MPRQRHGRFRYKGGAARLYLSSVMRILLLLSVLSLLACNTPAQKPLPYGPDDTASRTAKTTVPDRSRNTPAVPVAPMQKGSSSSGRAVHIVDGDTFDLLTPENEKIRIRMHGVDAPEKSQDFGSVAKDGLGSLLDGAALRVVVADRDRYGRSVCDVWTSRPGGPEVWVNEALVRRGWAWHYSAYSRDARLAAAEIDARREKAGLWAQPDPTPPWEYRKAKRTKAARRKK